MAVTIARQARAKLRLLTVHRPPPAPLAADDAKIYLEADLASRRAERAYLRQQAERLRAGETGAGRTRRRTRRRSPAVRSSR